jgi:hypothetical protein
VEYSLFTFILVVIVKMYATRLSLDVVALRDIQEGETLVAGASADSMARLIPDEWRV